MSELGRTVVTMEPSGPAWHPGCQSQPARTVTAIEPALPGSIVFRHVRDPALHEPDTNVGWWVLQGLSANHAYHFSCQILVPGNFQGSRVRLCLGHPLEREVAADLTLRDRWQPVFLELTLCEDLEELSVVLRVDSDLETVLYSSNWQVGVAPVSTEAGISARAVDSSPTSGQPDAFTALSRAGPSAPIPVIQHSQPWDRIEEPDVLRAGEQFLALARAAVAGRESADAASLVSAYVLGAGSYADHQYHQARELIDQAAGRHGILPADDSLFDDRQCIRRNVVAALCPELLPSLFAPRSNSELETISLLDGCPNELADNRLPPPLNVHLYQPRRPPVFAYATTDACLYAHPLRYQVLSKDRSGMWLSGSPRRLSRDAIGATELIAVDKDVVVLQDRFDFSSISHFLFDGVSRVLLLEQALGTLRSSLLVFGGVPGEYHATICGILCAILNLPSENILFPDRPMTIETSRRCIWFSDQVETSIHPAQMAHPVSIGLLHALAARLPGAASEHRRVYLAGTQPRYMRIANDEAVSAMLAARGFVTIAPNTLSIAEQIGVVRGAEIIVAPHGEALTHLIAAERAREVIELFSPLGGTETFAFVAAAGGIRHNAMIGTMIDAMVDEDNHADYAVDVEGLARRVDMAGMGGTLPAWRKPANLLPASRSMARFYSAPDATDTELAVPALVWDNAISKHRSGDMPGSTVLGRWPAIQLTAGVRYTLSCWVWLPEAFEGEEITLGITGAVVHETSSADLCRRGSWQRIFVSATSFHPSPEIELRMTSPVSASFASTCWQLEKGGAATAYVATPDT